MNDSIVVARITIYPVHQGMGYAFDVDDPTAILTRDAFLAAPSISTRLPVVPPMHFKFIFEAFWVHSSP